MFLLGNATSPMAFTERSSEAPELRSENIKFWSSSPGLLNDISGGPGAPGAQPDSQNVELMPREKLILVSKVDVFRPQLRSSLAAA